MWLNSCINLPFCLIFRHIVALTPGICSNSGTCLQSVIDNVLLSNGSEHFGSESERHSQHFIDRPESEIHIDLFIIYDKTNLFLTQAIVKHKSKIRLNLYKPTPKLIKNHWFAIGSIN